MLFIYIHSIESQLLMEKQSVVYVVSHSFFSLFAYLREYCENDFCKIWIVGSLRE